MALIATIVDPAVVNRILTHLGMPTTVPPYRAPWRKQTALDLWDTDSDRHAPNDAVDSLSFAE